jgi:hypothetical protein
MISHCELRKVKISVSLSEETLAFTGELWVDGNLVAYASNHGRGGNNSLRHAEGQRDRLREFEAWCLTLPSRKTSYGDLAMDADFFITLLVTKHDEDKRLRRRCKTKTLIRLKGANDGEYVEYNRLYSAEFGDWVRSNEPTLTEIINERYTS